MQLQARALVGVSGDGWFLEDTGQSLCSQPYKGPVGKRHQHGDRESGAGGAGVTQEVSDPSSLAHVDQLP